MSTIKSNQVVRIFEVVLVDGADKRYDPMSVTLSWPEAKAPKDRTDPAVLAEAFARAVKIERRNYSKDADLEFTNGGVTCTRERLVHSSKAR